MHHGGNASPLPLWVQIALSRRMPISHTGTSLHCREEARWRKAADCRRSFLRTLQLWEQLFRSGICLGNQSWSAELRGDKMAAEGGGAPKQVIHIHIHNTSNEETIIQEQHVGDRTEIHGSNIGSVIAGQSGQGEEQDVPGEDEGDVAEGVEQMNLAGRLIPKPRKLIGKRKEKDSELKSDGGKTGQGMPDEETKVKGPFLKEKDLNQGVDDGRTGDVMQGRISEISGGAHGLTIQDGEFGQSIQKQVNETFQDSATGKTGRSVKPGALRICEVLSLLEEDPINMSSRVFRAILHSDVTGDKIVVAKITPADKRHRREAKIHFSVPHHKNIVERIITDIFRFRGQPSIYIVMECCDCNLYDHIKSQVRDEIPFDAKKYLSISRQIAVGLNFLHSHNVVHGDMKPGNVLLILDKNVAKLCDFGLSRAVSGDKTSTQLTLPQGGTTGWLAPEVLEETTKIGFKSDIFPLGLVTFHCLSYGKHPYGDKYVSWNHYIVKGKNRNLDGMLIPDADAAKVVLELMLKQNPADRPTAEEVLKNRMFASEGQDDGTVSKGAERMNLSRTAEGDSCTKSRPSLGEIQRNRRMKSNHAYEAEMAIELSLEPGDVVEVIKDNPSSASSSKPSTEKEDSSPKSKMSFNYCKAIYDFLRRSDDELDLVKGEIVRILNREMQCHGWWEGEKEENGKLVKGLLPCSYVVELTTDEAKDYVKQLQTDSTKDATKGQDDGAISEGVERMNLSRTNESDSCTKSRSSLGEIQHLRRDEIKEQAADEVKQRNLSKTSEGFWPSEGSRRFRRISGLQKLFKKTKEKDSQAKVGTGKTGQAGSEERKKKITLLSERISALLKKSEHLEASKLLEELASLQSTKELHTSLQMAECFLYLEKLREARETIDTVRDVIVTSHALNANDVYKLGRDLCKKSSYVQAIILLRIASDLYKTNASSHDYVVSGIYKCIRETHDATKPLIEAGGRSRVIGLDFGVEYMKQMFDCLSDVENAEPGNKTLKQAWSLHYIEFNYGLANENEKNLKPLQTGIEILENQFGSNASKYRVYGALLNNTGIAYKNLGKFSDAEKYYVKSIEAMQKATDYADESEKQSDIEMTKSNLRNTRAKLGKR